MQTSLSISMSGFVGMLPLSFFFQAEDGIRDIGVTGVQTCALPIWVSSQLVSISTGWTIVLGIGAGTGAVLILRWYWWRINAWSEIVATIGAAVLTFVLANMKFSGNSAVVTAKTTLLTAAITTILCLAGTFLSKPEPTEKLVSFYSLVHPSIYGW